MSRTLTCLGALLLLSGCHSHFRRAEPVTTVDIIQFSKDGVEPDEIIRRIEASGTVYHMDSEDVTDLGKAGVDAKVIDHMMGTAARHAERRSRYYYRRRYYDPWYDPWYPHWHRHYYHPVFYPAIGFGFGFGCW